MHPYSHANLLTISKQFSPFAFSQPLVHSQKKYMFVVSNSRPILGEEIKHGLVATNVLFLDALISQVAAGSHPSVDLILEDLNVLGHLELLFELLDLVVRLLL